MDVIVLETVSVTAVVIEIAIGGKETGGEAETEGIEIEDIQIEATTDRGDRGIEAANGLGVGNEIGVGKETQSRRKIAIPKGEEAGGAEIEAERRNHGAETDRVTLIKIAGNRDREETVEVRTM